MILHESSMDELHEIQNLIQMFSDFPVCTFITWTLLTDILSLISWDYEEKEE